MTTTLPQAPSFSTPCIRHLSCANGSEVGTAAAVEPIAMVADRVKGGKTGGDVRPVVISDCWGPMIPAARMRRVARDVTRWVDDPGRNGYLCVRHGWRWNRKASANSIPDHSARRHRCRPAAEVQC